ncbi:hypothetical protein TIFTF001_033123 [Ficus carica]|uniref:Uncharacterized protein n=1 Tax=Ficus carica TaxID=3494 RepID=A0AA88J8S6_FICCA|nr:hypothetical protein TIFTF001_033123 [Ficus carica]
MRGRARKREGRPGYNFERESCRLYHRMLGGGGGFIEGGEAVAGEIVSLVEVAEVVGVDVGRLCGDVRGS